MNKWAFSAAGLAALVGSGCMSTQVASLRDRCTFTSDLRFASIKGKIPLSPAEVEVPPTLAEISNNAVPTPEESSAIYAYDAANAPCVAEATAIGRSNGSPGVVAIMTNLRQNSLRELKKLADRQISYGQFRQISYAYYVAANRELQGEVNAMQIVAAQQQAAAAAMTSAGAAMIQASRPVQSFDPEPVRSAPMTTNCRKIGQIVNCQSF
jgi:hypothetical protein